MFPERLTRREMLRRSAGAGLFFFRGAGFLQSDDEETLPWADLPEPLAPGARPGIRFYDLTRLRAPITSNPDFFLLQHGEVPRLDASRWRLAVGGLVEKPVELLLSGLQRRQKAEVTTCIECAGNGGYGMHGLVGNARWAGVPLAPVLDELGIRPGAREVVFTGADPATERLRGEEYPSRFARSLPLSEARDPGILLAYEMNGEPLPVEHGYPLRLIVPGWYGVAQVKWLERIELIDRPFMGWYMAKDYVTLRGEDRGGRIEYQATSVAKMKLKSIITRVTRRRFSKGADRYTICGAAWGNGARIRSVEIRIDGDEFRPAELEPPSSPFAWTLFHLRWRNPAPGPHTLVSRATDADDRTQPTEEEARRGKVTPWENNGQVARRIILS